MLTSLDDLPPTFAFLFVLFLLKVGDLRLNRDRPRVFLGDLNSITTNYRRGRAVRNAVRCLDCSGTQQTHTGAHTPV